MVLESALWEKEGHKKTAGQKISKSPSQWSIEVIKALVSNHPYVDNENVEVKFEDIDPEEKSAKGVVILHGEAGAPFSIGKDEDTRQIELDPLDILFIPEQREDRRGRICHFNKSSYRQAVQQSDIGRVFPDDEEGEEYAKLPPGNEYIGDLTGDVTPLEYSGYPNSISGAGALRTAQSGLLSRVIQDDSQLKELHKLLADHRGLNMAAEAVGLKKSLDDLPTEGEDTPIGRAQFVQIRRKDNGEIVVEYSNGHQAPISGANLEQALGDSYEQVMRKVMGRGWAIVRDFPTIKTPEAPTINTYPGPIEQGGWHRLVTKDGGDVDGVVCPKMIDFDGKTIDKQKVLTENNTWAEGDTFCGHAKDKPLADHPAAESELSAQTKGCFIRESFGETMATPNLKIKRIVDRPDTGTIIIAGRLDTMETIGLVVLESLTRPEKIQPGKEVDDLLPRGRSYFWPNHMDFVELDGKVRLADQSDRVREGRDNRPTAVLRKHANRYDLRGQTVTGKVEERMLDENEARMKLASLSCDDHVIEKAMELEDGEMELRGLRPCKASIKKQANDLPNTPEAQTEFRRFQKHAREAMKGYDEALEKSAKEDPEDPEIMDAILSMQFVDDDTLHELSKSEHVLIDAEDKIGRLLVACRRGVDGLHERGLKRALKGLGAARNTLETLRIELESREP